MQIFLDSDGVLADFDTLAGEILGMPSREFERMKHTTANGKMGGPQQMWDRLYSHEDFFYKLPKMPDADELVEGVESMGFTPIVLTGVPSKDGSDWAIGQKIRWYEEKFPHLQVITCKSKDKFLHMMRGKHNVLIDDWEQHRQKWIDEGGFFITHTSATQSLADLDQLLYDLECQERSEEFARSCL